MALSAAFSKKWRNLERKRNTRKRLIIRPLNVIMTFKK